jgi:hypothetical protein
LTGVFIDPGVLFRRLRCELESPSMGSSSASRERFLPLDLVLSPWFFLPGVPFMLACFGAGDALV